MILTSKDLVLKTLTNECSLFVASVFIYLLSSYIYFHFAFLSLSFCSSSLKM